MGRARLAALAIVLGGLLSASPASAAITTPFGPTGPTCTPDAGDRVCTGIVKSFDGAKVDVKLRLPAAPANPADPDGPYPLVMGFHGWGGSKDEYNLDRWVNKGYAAFTMSDRGWGNSCGGMDLPDRNLPICTGVGPGGAKGYNHLMDTRYEVRDAQVMAGKLVDSGVVDPNAIGAAGPSYGGGISMSLAALKDRVMTADGTLVPWQSAGGTPLHIAAAAPEIPWTDLAYSLVPNGSTLDYTTGSNYGAGPIGVMKQSFVSGLYGVGLAQSNFAPAGTDPSADVNGWYARLTAGEPYEGDPTAQAIVDEVTRFHSSYYIDHSEAPAPLLISNGFTDDLFPTDEAIRFYNRTRNQYPGADISLMFFDWGHDRGQNKDADLALLKSRQEAYFDHYLRGQGPKPANQAETLTQTCPATAPSGGPYTAPTWAALAPGEVRLQSAAQQAIAPGAGNPGGASFDPIGGGGACATIPADDTPNVANYRLPAAPAGGYTLMGAPTIVADIASAGPSSQVAARLLDVDPATNQETLVARGIYRPDAALPDATRQVFQLHPNGYLFAAGHIAKLELLPSDAPYARASNSQAPIAVSNLDLRLPVLNAPGSSPAVTAPVPKFVPAGYALSADYGGPENVDSDGDAVSDPADACPGQAGPESNGGCPLAPVSTPKPAANCSNAIKGTPKRDRLKGTSGSDRIKGRGGSDRIKGRGGDDCLAGQGGRDRITGGRGEDKLSGGKGRDRIFARDGKRDVIKCGRGKDRVVADARDKVRGNCEKVKVRNKKKR